MIARGLVHCNGTKNVIFLRCSSTENVAVRWYKLDSLSKLCHPRALQHPGRRYMRYR